MSENLCKKQSKTPLENPTVTSHCRTISTIPTHQNNISFMPKFLLKLLHKKKQSHIRSISIDFGIGKTERLDKTSKTDKHVHKSNTNYLLKFIHSSKRVSSIVSRKPIPPICSSSSVSTSEVENRGVLNREKSGKMKVEKKGGVKIKSLMKTKTKTKTREEGKQFELCKKKILMGEKCRPINGTLRYDKNGILVVPQDLPG